MKTSIARSFLTLCYACLTLAVVGISPLHAQQSGENGNDGENASNTKETVGPRRFWQASLPGGHYMVALDRISSISKHTYIMEGGLSVTEVVVDTSGNSLCRFYHIAPISDKALSGAAKGITERGKGIVDQITKPTGINPGSTVTKHYPTTTHAKTIEFHISSEADLTALYESVKKSWTNNRGVKISIQK